MGGEGTVRELPDSYLALQAPLKGLTIRGAYLQNGPSHVRHVAEARPGSWEASQPGLGKLLKAFGRLFFPFRFCFPEEWFCSVLFGFYFSFLIFVFLNARTFLKLENSFQIRELFSSL